MRYKIKDEELAKELHIDGLEGALVIDVKKIPPGMSVVEYIKFLEENNIILTYQGLQFTWLEHLLCKQKVVGSSPTFSTVSLFCFHNVNGLARGLNLANGCIAQRQSKKLLTLRFQVRILVCPQLVLGGMVTQLTLTQEIGGSSPSEPTIQVLSVNGSTMVSKTISEGSIPSGSAIIQVCISVGQIATLIRWKSQVQALSYLL